MKNELGSIKSPKPLQDQVLPWLRKVHGLLSLTPYPHLLPPFPSPLPKAEGLPGSANPHDFPCNGIRGVYLVPKSFIFLQKQTQTYKPAFKADTSQQNVFSGHPQGIEESLGSLPLINFTNRRGLFIRANYPNIK